jgi:hypothetical protein
MIQPTMHKPVPLGSRVVIRGGLYSNTLKELRGEVSGIASMHVLFHYIVSLDPDSYIETEYGTYKTISVLGTFLESEDGSNWHLDV